MLVWTAAEDGIIRAARWAGMSFEAMADLVEDRTPDSIRTRCGYMDFRLDPNLPPLAERRAAARCALIKRKCLDCYREFETDSRFLRMCEPCRERA